MLKRIIMSLSAALLLLAGLLYANLSPVQASPSNYSYAQRIPGASGTIQIKCHNAAGWNTLGVGQHSRTYCGSNGWVDYIRNPTTGALYARPIGGGAEISYGRNYSGPLRGGYYDVYLSNFCGGCGGGRVLYGN